MARLLISAAHTLESPGEIHGDLKEADLTRKIVKKTLPHLDQLKVEYRAVPLDLPLMQRIEWINNSGFTEAQGDIFVEVHINDGGKTGVEAWFEGAKSDSNKSQKMSEVVSELLCKKMNFTNQGAKSEYDHELGSLLILNQTNTISTAIEILYIDNPTDGAILRDDKKLDDIAKALAESISEYLKNPPKVADAPAGQVEKKDPFGGLFGNKPDPFSNPGGTKPPTPGMFGGADPFAKPSFGGFGGGGASKGSGAMMDREERKEMIKKVYDRILGKEPSQADLNMNLNTAVSEEDLTKKLLEGDEHKEVIKNAKEFKETKTKFERQEGELAEVKAKVRDLNLMHENQNKLLDHKNKYIAQLQEELRKRNIAKNGEYFSADSLYRNNQDSTQSIKLHATAANAFPDNLVKRLMKIFRI